MLRSRVTNTPKQQTVQAKITYRRYKEKSTKYKGVFKVKYRVKTWQVRGIWSQQLEHKQVQKRSKEPGIRKGKRFLLAPQWDRTRCPEE